MLVGSGVEGVFKFCGLKNSLGYSRAWKNIEVCRILMVCSRREVIK